MTPLEAILSLRDRLDEKGIKNQFLEELIVIEKALRALDIIIKKCSVWSTEKLTEDAVRLIREVIKQHDQRRNY